MLSITTQNQIDAEWERKAETFYWEDKHPAYPAGDVRDDRTRRALDTIARLAVPFFEQTHAYYSDLLWDAQNAALMSPGSVAFITVRSVGTHWFTPHDQSGAAITAAFGEARECADSHAREDYPAAVLIIKADQWNSFVGSVEYVTPNE